ncbi:hypothetical protein, partial [Legionella pneumophila]|uniref:hypothetical protein n=1 Tax=Legionella pneumophila TaxID=446 RepID=UPI001E4A74FE
VIFNLNGLNRKGNLGHAWLGWKRPKPLARVLIPGTLCPIGTNIVTMLIVTLPCRALFGFTKQTTWMFG